MYIGIDVGGTYTDTVLMDGDTLVTYAKYPTEQEQVMKGILAGLDEVLRKTFPEGVPVDGIEKVTLSTTMVTNQVVTHRWDTTDLYMVQGPGANITGLTPVEPILISGYTDHRGIEVEPLGSLPVLEKRGRNAAVSAKFAVRNPAQEHALATLLGEVGYACVSEGAALSGNLNVVRRANSAYFNSAVYQSFREFADAVRAALAEREIVAPVYILKADGGSLPLESMLARPVETIFTGPAASVLGMEALQSIPKEDTVAIDIGGTTTDISLWREGAPLMAREGIAVDGYDTAVRSFQVYSVGIGGDSVLRYSPEGELQIGPDRVGPAMAAGGRVPTLGDALIALGAVSYGDCRRSTEAMMMMIEMQTTRYYGNTTHTIAAAIVKEAVRCIGKAIQEAVAKENHRPIYVVEDIVEGKPFIPERLVAVGGTAQALAEALGEGLQLPLIVPKGAAVANAIGAAVAKPTLELTVRVDTAQGTVVVPELGLQEVDRECRTLEDAIEKGKACLLAEVKRQNMPTLEVEVVQAETFSMVEGWRSYPLFTVRLQGKSGVTTHVTAYDIH